MYMEYRFISCIMNIAVHRPRRKYTKKEKKNPQLRLCYDMTL